MNKTINSSQTKRLVWVSWKSVDKINAGGAEVVTHNILERLINNGFRVTHRYPNGSIILFAITNFIYMIRNFSNFDYVVEEVNTIPLFSFMFTNSRTKKFLFYHQLAREVWWYQVPPIVSHFGYYIFEPAILFIYSTMARFTNTKVITISNSTKADLVDFGFSPECISIISQGIEISPIVSLSSVEKYDEPTILSLGAIREMKRTLDIVKAFEIAKRKNTKLTLKIAGSADGKYGEKVLDYISQSKYKSDIKVLGKVSESEKIVLMQKSHIITVTSIKEGWGLVVTEANSQGTPACVYNVDGLRDSTQSGVTGLVSESGSIGDLADNMLKLLEDKSLYENLQNNAWQFSKELNFDRCYDDFSRIILN